MADGTGEAGAAIYNPFVLFLYDFWVLYLSNTWAWGCPTQSVLRPFFHKHLKRRHLDIGVGTGSYLQNLPPTMQLTLMDLNPNALNEAKHRAGLPSTSCVQHDVMHDLPGGIAAGGFDSISVYYLFHCMPGPVTEKTKLIGRLAPCLNEQDGVLYGATILGKGVQHNWFGRYLMSLYNGKGVFGNLGDGPEDFEDALNASFDDVETEIVGRVLLFAASKPKRKTKMDAAVSSRKRV